ncbi:MAG: ATP-binding protein [Candidatus Omnitrophota bacterium]|jgi:two-component system phosphate regulon sensor histidine kinase PhoR
MKIKPRGFKFKLISSYILILFISFSFTTYFLSSKLEKNTLESIRSSLLKQAFLVANQIPLEKMKRGDREGLDALIEGISLRIRCRVTVINTGGEVFFDSDMPLEELPNMENHAGRPEIRSAFEDGAGAQIRYSSTLKIDMLYVAVPIRDNGGAAGVVRLSLPLTDIEDTLSDIRKTIIFSLVFAMALAFILGSIFISGIANPLNRIINISRKFSEGDLEHKIIINSMDEIGQLAEALNGMADNLKDKISQIKTQNQKLRAIFDSMVEGVIVTDSSMRITSINPTAEKIFGVLSRDAEGKYFLEVLRNNELSEIIIAVLEKKGSLSKELKISWPLQKIFRVNASAIFEKDSTAGCLLVIHDITEIRKLETMRRDFVANLSHELKTPLTSIRGFIETLLEGALEDRENSRHFLQIIQEHSIRLGNLVDDLLSLSYLESREITLEKVEFNLKKFVDDILAGFKSQLKKKSVSASNSLPDSLMITADKDKIGQVLTNLFDNGIKFNRENGALKVYSEISGGAVKIIVEDSGAGIPSKDTLRIFERFYRVDKARSRELGGTGLGLSIVKHIVELHGGNTGVESTQGLGSKFWFTLPM